MKRAAILQSNYIPWKGYFDLIAYVDEFVIYDDAQYTKNDWRNRNLIKTPTGAQWLTVPVSVTGNYKQLIREAEIQGNFWREKHWKSLCSNYGKSHFFKELAPLLERLYATEYRTISALNLAFIDFICSYLGINTKISYSWDYSLCDGRTERLVHLCQQIGAEEYVSGPAAKEYLNEDLFAKAGIQVAWFDYAGYPEYPQLWGDFVHGVSVLDLIFNCGKDAPRYMRFLRD
jgi:hypothetical protein